jgi:orotate phosphoribosyltransferase-like protein
LVLCLLCLYRKKGISSVELAKELGVGQRTAWFVLHRLRESSDCSLFKTMLKDFVEIDETYSGGSNLNRH